MQTPRFPNKIYPVDFTWSHRPKCSYERVASMKICCRLAVFGPGKLTKSPGKVLEKSWNIVGLMVYEPWYRHVEVNHSNIHDVRDGHEY